MNSREFIGGVMAALVAGAAVGGPARQEMRFVDGTKVVVDDAFWGPKLALWRTNTVFDVFDKFERQSHAFANFDKAAKGEQGGHCGAHFFDGLVYESLRGACDYLAREPSDDLAKLIDNAVDRIVAAQRKDGYLHTWVQLGHADRQWGDNGGCPLEQHEIYDAGCLVEAGVHHYRATGKTKLLAAAMRFANYLCDTIGPRPKRNLIPSHSIAEEALVKLARLLKDEPGLAAKAGVKGRPDDYLALVKFWFDAHGDNCGLPDWKPLIARSDNAGVIAAMRELTKTKHDAGWRISYWDYQMDAKPLREYRAIEGHAVRAALLVLGLAAYARETGDAESLELARRFWNSMTGRKMYISGGVGAKADLERFADDYELPPDAYLETCAAVASAFTSGCLAEIEPDGKYMDEFERVLYNALLTAVGSDGRTYTYQNPLNTAKGGRWAWHGCPCCPPMFLKLTGALPGYVYGTDAKGVRVNLFMGSRTEVVRDGVRVAVAQRTKYPDEGRVEIAVDPERPVRFRLAVRIPGWARGVESHSGLYVADERLDWSLAFNGHVVEAQMENGYAVVDREWRKGDVLTVNVDVSPRTVRADPRVKEVRGMHAIVRGPVVMAEERGKTIPYWRVANEGEAPHKVWSVAAKVSPAEAVTNEWPFAILRSYGSYEENKLFTERVFAAQERHPGLFGEIWFGGDGGLDYTAEERGKLAEKTNPGIRERCRKLGIAFSYQQGVTLNHGEDGLKRDFIPEDAWAVSRDGKPAYGILCCTSPWALDYQRETAKAIMGRLQPDSYWPDDDLRLLKGDWNAAYYCFCDRCVKLFGESYGQAFTRETLVKALNGPDGSADVRKAWCAFNGRNLGACAKVYREAADAVSPRTRLGIQIALSGNTVDGDSWKTMVQALAGKGGKAGTRPGGLYYCDSKPHEILWKMQLVAREAARSGGLPEIGQICYEVENWPHVGGHKNAHGMMAECAWALAVGCDSIAFYWGADQNGEDAASYDFWLDAVWAWRPFQLAVRDAFAGTRLGGVAAYHGANHWATKGWANHDEMEMSALMMCAVPVTVAEAAPDALWLNERCVETLAEGDLKGVFAKPVVMSAAAFVALAKRFPELAFAKKISCEFPEGEKALATAKRANGYELFPSGLKSANVKAYILPKSADVKTFSTMTADGKACGTCVIPTEFGGKVVVAQEVPAHTPHAVWPGCRRHAILDALDFATPGGQPARLLTDGYSVAVTVRTDADGRTAGVFLLNLGSGETPPLEVAIRRGTKNDWRVLLPRREGAPAEVVRRTDGETVVRVPPLGAFGVALVY